MKNQITFKGGIALMAMSLIFLSSCKKEEITRKASGQSENQASGKIDYKFSAVAKIPGEKAENGYLSLKVSSNDEAYLKKYVAKLEQTKVLFEETLSTKDKEENIQPLLKEESKITVALSFDWTNFSSNLEKGKLYAIKLVDQAQTKALVYYGFSNSNSFDIGGPAVPGTVAAVNVYSTYNGGCTWYFNNTVSDFYSKGLNYHDNLEVRCYQLPFSFSTPQSFVINGIRTYYRPRFNYVSDEMPTSYTDVDAISSGYGYVAPLVLPGATLTFYIAG